MTSVYQLCVCKAFQSSASHRKRFMGTLKNRVQLKLNILKTKYTTLSLYQKDFESGRKFRIFVKILKICSSKGVILAAISQILNKWWASNFKHRLPMCIRSSDVKREVLAEKTTRFYTFKHENVWLSITFFSLDQKISFLVCVLLVW